MHLYMTTRGIKHEVDQFITELQGKYLPFKFRDASKGEKEPHDVYLQMSVRPIQLWELCFPEDQKDVVLNTIFGKDRGEPYHKKHKKYVKILQKVLGVDALPEYSTEQIMPIRKQGIDITAIGVKKDKWIGADDKVHDEKIENSFEAV